MQIQKKQHVILLTNIADIYMTSWIIKYN